jgi:hypothetical protein
MSAQVGDIHNLDRGKRTKSVSAAPYASRGAGLYSEVSWDPGASLPARDDATRSAGAGSSRDPDPVDKA